MESNRAGNGKVVCVTGASGFIASWLVKLLLLRGYTVKGTVRDLNNSNKTEHLLKLERAKERLHLMEANLLEEGSFDSAVEGCDGVLHTASPVSLGVKVDPHVEFIDPAMKGTLNVLKSCAKTSSVKRVVLTSSVAAVFYNAKPRTPQVIVDETWFSDADICKQNEEWSGYVLSKTLAEEAAWKFAEENNIDLITINPAAVIGPLLQPTLNATANLVLILLNGTKTFPNVTFGWVNVKDVANAHIQAFEIPSASGRYILSERVTHYSYVVEILHDLYPTLQLPEKCADDKPLMPMYQISKEKAKTLGIEFIPLEVSLKEMMESFKEKKLVEF